MKRLIPLQLALFLKNPLLSGQYIFVSTPPSGPPGAPSSTPPGHPPPPSIPPEGWIAVDAKRRETRTELEQALGLAEGVRGVSPSPEIQKKFTRIQEEMRKLLAEDDRNMAALRVVLDPILIGITAPDEKITLERRVKELFSMTPKHRKQGTAILESIRTRLTPAAFNQLKALKEEDYRIKQRVDTLQKQASKTINPVIERLNREGERIFIIQMMEKSLGVELKLGTKIQYTDHNEPDPAAREKTIEIASVVVHQKKYDAEVADPVVINLTNGRSFSIGGLSRLIEDGQGYELFDAHHAVEEFLEWNMFGIKIEPEATFEYEQTDPTDLSKKITQRVKIVRVENKEIELDQEIVLSKLPLLKKKVVTLGEFARFASRVKLNKAMANAEELKTILQNYNVNYNRKYNLKDEKIELKKDEELETESDGIWIIDAIEADKIVLKQGGITKPLTFAQFLNWIQENDARKHTAPASGGGASGDGGHGKKPNGDHGDGAGADGHDEHENGGLGHWYHAFMHETVWLSPMDIQGMIKVFVEYFKREHGTKSGMRFASVGKHIPNKKWAREYQREFYSREGEAVHKQVESMKHQGVYDILKVLYNAKEEYMLKAAFEELASRGQIRWDDKNIHKAMNRFISGHLDQIPIDKPLPRGKSYEFDYIKPAIDHWWGENTFNNWHRQNHDTFSGNKKKFFSRYDQLEGDPGATGGLTAHTANLLRKHKMGEWVDPQEYEAAIDFAITKGKMDMERRIYYLIQGVSAKGGPDGGKTILHLDRIGVIAGDHLPIQHYLEFLTNKGIRRDPKTGEIIEERDPKTGEMVPKEDVGWSVEMFQKIAKNWDESGDIVGLPKDNLKKYRPNARVRSFFSQYAMTHEATHTRGGKGTIEGGKIDHDDWHWYVAILDEVTITSVMQKTGATRMNISPEGVMNGYAGYAQYLKSVGIMEKDELDKYGWKIDQIGLLQKSIKSFVRFDTIASNILEKDKDSYNRLSSDALNKPIVVDGKKETPRYYREQGRKVLQAICEEYGRAYGQDGLIEEYKQLGISPEGVYDFIYSGQQPQDKIEGAIRRFGEQFDEWMKKDNGKRMQEIIKASVEKDILSGMKGYTLESDL